MKQLNLKKSLIILLSVVALTMIIGFNIYKMNLGDSETKNIHLVIDNGAEVIFDKKVKTNTATVAELLIELDSAKSIDLNYEDSAYGMYIKGLGKGDGRLFFESPNSGLYWVYESANNKKCVENGYCDAASTQTMDDGDIFTFKLTKYE